MPPSSASLDTLLVVTHTHWDREWYRTVEEFRPTLVALIDEVLEGRSGDRFLLDGQTILLLDYLGVRPERRAPLAAALAAGRLEAGPWYVLADNLIPSGEALVRNLLAGRELLRELGGAPPAVLYCPDAFGHPAALPQIAAGFGAPVAVVWRGYGGAPWPPGDCARWRAADGSEALLYHLPPDGYEVGANLPSAPGESSARWALLRGILAPRATLGVALLPHGADHHALQTDHAEALGLLTASAHPIRVVRGGLADFERLVTTRAARWPLPVVHGELRHSPSYAWSLQGTFGTRAAQKRTNARAERALVCHVEPRLALAEWHDGRPRGHLARALWRDLLACHPHDTLCGCSRDEVAASMDERMGGVLRGAAAVAWRSHLDRLGDDPSASRAAPASDPWREMVAIWNPLPRARRGVAELEVDEVLGPVPVGPGSAGHARPTPRGARLQLAGGALATQVMAHTLTHARDESPRHYPRNALVRRRRVLVWLDHVPPLGAAAIPLTTPGARPPAVPAPVRANALSLENGWGRAWVEGSGRRRALHVTTADGASLPDILALEIEGDRGDLYTPSPMAGTRQLGTLTSARRGVHGALRSTLRLEYRVPLAARRVTMATGDVVSAPGTTTAVQVQVQLDAGSERLVFHVSGWNRATDCRLRLLVRTGIRHPEVWADAAFGPVQRAGGTGVDVSGEDGALGSAREAVVRTAPLHRYVSCFAPDRGVTVASDGLAEYEALDDGTVAITLLRAVGDLSRADLPERPGHAGWPLETPLAQCFGPFEARVALIVHGPRHDAALAYLHEAVEDWLLPLEGATYRSPFAPPSASEGPRLSGAGLAYSSCKPADDGDGMILRCVNLRAHAVDGAWDVPGVREAMLVRLDESPLGALAVAGERVRFHAPPRATISIRVRR